MVDNLTPQDQEPAPLDATAASDGEKKQGFLATKNGRIILIVGAVVAFLAIAGIVVAVVAGFFLKGVAEDALQDISNQISSQTPTSTPAGSDATAPAAEPGEVPLSDIFTFRDIFDPLVKPAPPAEDPGEDAGPFVGAADTLYLLDIVVEDGVTKAVLSYDGTEYKAAVGDILGTTPWQVLSIGSSSAVMLYGDTQVTLSVGQGVTDNSGATGGTTTK